MFRKIYVFTVFILMYFCLFPQTPPSIEWTQTFSIGAGLSIVMTENGNYTIVGFNGYSSGGDLYYLQIDESGNMIWEKYIADDYGRAESIIRSESNEYLITGAYNDSTFISKINEVGDSLFFYSGYDSWTGLTLDIAQDSTLIIGGNTIYGYVMNVDSFGNIIWEIDYPDEWHIWGDYQNSSCTDVKFLNDGNIMIAGRYYSYFQQEQRLGSYLIKADSNGNEIWYVDFWSSYNTSINPTKFVITNNDEFVMIGRRNKIYKISSEGEEIWDVETDYSLHSIISHTSSSENYYYIVGNIIGYNYSNPCLLKIDDNGNIIWEQIYNAETEDFIYELIMTDDDGFLLIGSSDHHLYIMKLSSEISNTEGNYINPFSAQLNQNYPNPFNPSTTIYFTAEYAEDAEISIYNIKGQKVKTLNSFPNPDLSGGMSEVVWSGVDDDNKPVSSGIYFYQLRIDGNSRAINKMILIK